MRSVFLGWAAAMALMPAAGAQTFEGSDGIELREVFGSVMIRLEGDGPLTVSRSGPGADDLMLREGRAVSILGEFDHRAFKDDFREAMRGYRTGSNRSERAFLEMLKDQPTLTITAAPGTAIRVVDGAVKMKVIGPAGAVEIEDNAMLLVTMDDFETGSIEVNGMGDVRVGSIAGQFNGAVHGSGDLTFEDAGSAQIAVHGSGDLEGGDIAGNLKATVHGSGDAELGEVGGSVGASVHGSGDLDLGKVTGGLDASIHGSGDLTVVSLSDTLKVSVRGSGDLEIGAGSVSVVEARVSGSGEVRFAGKTVDADLETGGSGSIKLGGVSGNLIASGKNIRIDGQRVGSSDG